MKPKLLFNLAMIRKHTTIIIFVSIFCIPSLSAQSTDQNDNVRWDRKDVSARSGFASAPRDLEKQLRYNSSEGGLSIEFEKSFANARYYLISAHASLGTIIECDGVEVAIVESTSNLKTFSAFAEIVIRVSPLAGSAKGEWKRTNYYLPSIETSEGLYVALPNFLIMRSKSPNLAALFMSGHPFYFDYITGEDSATNGGEQVLNFVSGDSGAVVYSAYQFEENPFYRDSNNNLIEDYYEAKSRRSHGVSFINRQNTEELLNGWFKQNTRGAARKIDSGMPIRPLPKA